MKQVYPAIIHEEDGSFWVEFPDLVGCLKEGSSLAETLENAEEVLGLFLVTLEEEGKELPVPSVCQKFYKNLFWHRLNSINGLWLKKEYVPDVCFAT